PHRGLLKIARRGCVHDKPTLRLPERGEAARSVFPSSYPLCGLRCGCEDAHRRPVCPERNPILHPHFISRTYGGSSCRRAIFNSAAPANRGSSVPFWVSVFCLFSSFFRRFTPLPTPRAWVSRSRLI